MFSGFPEETVEFFMDLRFHNSSSFFHENHDRYIATVQKPFYDMINELAADMCKVDPLMEVRPHKCLSRIHRDTRFTKDKSPYRDHLWYVFRRANEPREGSVNFFFEFGASTLGWGMGFWGENKPVLELFRRQIEANPDAVRKVIRSCGIEKNNLLVEGRFHKRMAVPTSVPEDLKSWYLARDIYICKNAPAFGLAFDPDLIETVRHDLLALAPMYKLFRGLYDQSME